jgi:hypothetical protein
MEQPIESLRDHSRRKPDGGYVLIPAMRLLSAYTAHREDFIRLVDLRIWLACHELVARRCGARKGCPVRYTTRELAAILNSPHESRVSAGVKRLGRAGLLSWSASKVGFPEWNGAGIPEVASRLRHAASLVANHRRRVPVPRRLIVWLAREGTGAMIATAFGHLLRCLYFRGGACAPSGLCKASWVADVFGVHPRTVKTARRALVENGWLRTLATPQWVRNRWGQRFTVNLEWRATPAGERVAKAPPRRGRSTPCSPPPESHRELSSRRLKHQDPAPRGRAGAYARPQTLAPPTIRHVVAEDLRCPKRLDALFAQAHRAGFVGVSECDRQRVFAAAGRALRVGATNPAGLFVWLVRERRWDHLCVADEEHARSAARRPGQSLSSARYFRELHPTGRGALVRLGETVGDVLRHLGAGPVTTIPCVTAQDAEPAR